MGPKEHCTVQGAFLDISAAFDKVWHKGLLSKLCQVGICGKFIDLFTSYLMNRKQCVVIEGVKSNLVDIKAGVPQGSRLVHCYLFYLLMILLKTWKVRFKFLQMIQLF